jgi:hypothetical protein
MLSSLQNSPSAIVPELAVEQAEKIKNFRTETEQEDLYFYGQHLNTPGLLLEEYPAYYDSNFEVANRAFYATINKFTRQNCPDASKKRNTYSFLENWHLHSIYSKSQQTLLGITPVRPSVLLSGDDFMFTPPFIQQEPEEDYMQDDDEDEYWNEYYNLSPCPDSNHQEQEQDIIASSSTTLFKEKQEQEYFYSFGADDRPIFPQNIWLGNEAHSFDSSLLTIHTDNNEQDIVILDPLSPEEPELSVCSSSSDEQPPTHSSSRRSSISSISISSINSNFTTNDDYNAASNTLIEVEEPKVAPNSPVTRSESFFSQRSSLEDSASIMSYQSLADLINSSSPPKSCYGSIDHPNASNTASSSIVNTYDEEMGIQQTPPKNRTLWGIMCIYIMYLWQLLVSLVTVSPLEREPLL